MFKSVVLAIILTVQGLVALQASAAPLGQLRFDAPAKIEVLRLVQSQFPIQPSQAATIAQQANPGATVLGVKLLPSGEYAVTLKVGGSVQRVMVNATSGQLS
ncbi:PepSY domain-containing protein [Aestuariivirga litoralis]|uniref:PepSY domain-containing protein n=1 Tax=Aestuariivirga litoralis TaxID=2650924 RepID=UPI0018C7B83A|nr:PepSY domain-containing protein [Aestuariivirga litoralis]MBG1232223.1 hypothetical protein [Aestuariivirga litoralis]